MSPGVYGRIAGRSGLGVRGIDVAAGVVDCDYRGEIKVVLVNHTDEPFEVRVGDRIAQMILTRYEPMEPEECLEVSVTERGEAGFGSTGR